MADPNYKFDLPPHEASIIKVIGVGGGGCNAVNYMYDQGIKDVEFVVCNTDAQALEVSPVQNKLQIGVNLTGGLGVGADPEKGKNAALESKEEIRELLSNDTKMVFITAGMGGGTGTGAAPEIARVAKELGILTVGIVTSPFSFEGKKKMEHAKEGIAELRKNADTVLVILNDKLNEVYGKLSLRNAFAQADNILAMAAKGIAEIITVPGYVNVDFEDVRTVMMGAGAAVMGSVKAEGENRAKRAAEECISSPLLNERDINGAEKILLSIRSGEKTEMQMDELTEITEYIQEQAGDNAEVIFGHGVDDTLGESIRVTIIATGFDGEKQVKDEPDSDINKEPSKNVYDLDSNKKISAQKQRDQQQELDFNQRTYSWETVNNLDKNAYPQAHEEEESQFEESNEEKDDYSKSQELDEKRNLLRQRSLERSKHLQVGKSGSLANSDDFKDKFDKPAYLRKKINLKEVPHSSERNISRYNLNDDNQILGNNRFLHDNVD